MLSAFGTGDTSIRRPETAATRTAQGYAKIAALISTWPAWRAWFDSV
jgi:hypothetical protein